VHIVAIPSLSNTRLTLTAAEKHGWYSQEISSNLLGELHSYKAVSITVHDVGDRLTRPGAKLVLQGHSILQTIQMRQK
jgi:hypothetical protein